MKTASHSDLNIPRQLGHKHDRPFHVVPIVDDSLNILLVEDDFKDAQLIKDLIVMKQKSQWQLTHVQRMSEAIKLLKQGDFNVVILDLFLPDSGGMLTLQKLITENNAVPVIVMTNLKDENIGKDAIRQGAQDYLVKGQVTSDFFIRAIQYAIERKKLDKLRDELVSYVNHEISSPLCVIKDGLSQISNGVLGQVNAQQEQFLDLTLSGIDRLMTITEDFLLCTKLELGKLSVKKEQMSFNVIIKEIADTFRTSFAQKGIDLRVQLPFWDVRINADRQRVGQILTNLLNNALKHTQQGYVKITVQRLGRHIRCVIKDTGPGIAKEDIPKLFCKYGQIASSAGKAHKGTGLGLFICKTLVELHGGTIQVKSRLGLWSKFIFTLPLK